MGGLEGVATAPSLFGKGVGLFVRRDFVVGEEIVREIPLAKLEAASILTGDNASLAESYDKLAASGQRDALLNAGHETGEPLFRNGGYRAAAFSRCAADLWPSEGAAIQEAFAAAMELFSFNSHVSKPLGQFHIVYRVCCRANHSCAPNAVMEAPDEGEGTLVCCSALAAGDEVTASYISDNNLLQSRQRRRSLLEEGWDFSCCCIRCRAVTDDSRQFSCSFGCGGMCLAMNDSADLAVDVCGKCGLATPVNTVDSWASAEKEVENLQEGLPGTLFSAWASCETFATAHPAHWLAGRWKRCITGHLEREASEEEDPDEMENLLAEVATHRSAFEEFLGRMSEVLPHLSRG